MSYLTSTFPTSTLRQRLGHLLDLAASESFREQEYPSSLRGDLPKLIHHLGLLLAGATPEALRTVSPSVVGYGSTITARDLDNGMEVRYSVMSGSAMDVDVGHVSIESPLGRSLLGRGAGEEVEITTPRGPVRLRIEKVTTLGVVLDEMEDALDRRSRRRRRVSGI